MAQENNDPKDSKEGNPAAATSATAPAQEKVSIASANTDVQDIEEHYEQLEKQPSASLSAPPTTPAKENPENSGQPQENAAWELPEDLLRENIEEYRVKNEGQAQSPDDQNSQSGDTKATSADSSPWIQSLADKLQLKNVQTEEQLIRKIQEGLNTASLIREDDDMALISKHLRMPDEDLYLAHKTTQLLQQDPTLVEEDALQEAQESLSLLKEKGVLQNRVEKIRKYWQDKKEQRENNVREKINQRQEKYNQIDQSIREKISQYKLMDKPLSGNSQKAVFNYIKSGKLWQHYFSNPDNLVELATHHLFKGPLDEEREKEIAGKAVTRFIKEQLEGKELSIQRTALPPALENADPHNPEFDLWTKGKS